MDTCDGCGFTYNEDEAGAAASAIRIGTGELKDLVHALDGPTARTRPDADTWSPQEYACHVRDVLLVQRERVLQALREETPSFPPMGRDERVAHDGYASQNTRHVERQLLDAALMFTNVLDRLEPAQWERTLMYNYPRPWSRSLRWVAVHTLHEVRHHTADVRRQLEPS